MTARLLSRMLLTVALLLPLPVLAQLRFHEGHHYTTVPAPQATGLAPAGKIEVSEVFSYICYGCYQAQALAEEIRTRLPADAVMTFVHAGFNTHWPLFQRGLLTAQALGLADRNHHRLFTDIWETRTFPFLDAKTNRPIEPPPVIRDVARFYARGGGVSEADFVKKAASPEIEAAVARTEALIKGWQVGSTPTFVVAGRYRVNGESVSSAAELRDLIGFLISMERSRLKAAPARKK